MIERLVSVAGWAMFAALDAAQAADQLACRVFVYRVPRDLVLDSLLGPAEDFEYARTVAPTT